MTTGLYGLARLNLLKGGSVDWVADTIKCVPVIAGYVPNFATDQFLSDVAGAAIPETPQALVNKTRTAVSPAVEYDADDTTFPAVAIANGPILGILIYKDTGVAGTSILIGYFDNLANLPLTTTGNDVIVHWPDGAGKIFFQ